jgi:hypothetical protein
MNEMSEVLVEEVETQEVIELPTDMLAQVGGGSTGVVL